METMGLRDFYRDKKVLVTGHTGFKGSWLVLLLSELGAKITGISLDDAQLNSIYYTDEISDRCDEHFVDICDYQSLRSVFTQSAPDYVFHLAAEALVIRAQSNYLRTFHTNLIGTLNIVNLCEEMRTNGLVITTTDKVYENNETGESFYETDKIGGDDAYSVSKSFIELALRSLRIQNSFSIPIATARAGNVIGGGDWAQDRLVPDLFRAHTSGQILFLRNSHSIRPWQHVLDPLFGYLKYMQHIATESKYEFTMNFGPDAGASKTVNEVIEAFALDCNCKINEKTEVKEKNSLFLNNSLALQKLNWKPQLQFLEAIDWTKDWYQTFNTKNLSISKNQVDHFLRISK
jgi:CDP-glucose 4,6-dehydratase